MSLAAIVVIASLLVTGCLGSAIGPSVSSTVAAGAAATATISSGDYFGTGDTNAIRGIEVFLGIWNDTTVENSPNATIPECESDRFFGSERASVWWTSD